VKSHQKTDLPLVLSCLNLGHFPVGFVKTPLSALGLKHNPRPDPTDNGNNISKSLIFS